MKQLLMFVLTCLQGTSAAGLASVHLAPPAVPSPVVPERQQVMAGDMRNMHMHPGVCDTANVEFLVCMVSSKCITLTYSTQYVMWLFNSFVNTLQTSIVLFIKYPGCRIVYIHLIP
jgi:hypothetical protein